eukprot:TRINITY_DN58_c0_g3_i1.p1 TRINITY_DN58_c0_g3~~TRINITY_DN58_c0_g3_i1.p1  ORF type:complete len:197 (-),score=37.90 TRINITY_DN58_c0_g3_i1:124-714(-)
MASKKGSGPGVYAYLTFHVRTEKLATFLEAIQELLAASQGKDQGCLTMELHRELPWAQCLSCDEFQLFLMCQEWASAKDLEAHMSSKHAMRFNDAVVGQRLLATEPSVSIFGSPMTPADVASLGADAAAQSAALAAEAEARAKMGSSSGYRPPTNPPTPSRIAQGGAGSSTPSSTMKRTGSRSSLLAYTGAMTLAG